MSFIVRVTTDGTITFEEVRERVVLADLYRLIGCTMVEPVYLHNEDLVMWADEEGFMSASPTINAVATRVGSRFGTAQPFVGNVVFTSNTEEAIVGLNPRGLAELRWAFQAAEASVPDVLS